LPECGLLSSGQTRGQTLLAEIAESPALNAGLSGARPAGWLAGLADWLACWWANQPDRYRLGLKVMGPPLITFKSASQRLSPICSLNPVQLGLSQCGRMKSHRPVCHSLCSHYGLIVITALGISLVVALSVIDYVNMIYY